MNMRMEGLIKTSKSPLFSSPQRMPAEARVRRLKATIDALLLRAMHESLDDGQDQLSDRVGRAYATLEALTCTMAPDLWCRFAAYAVYESHFEQATIITDRLLMQGMSSTELYLVSALAQLYERRFQEARDALMSARRLANHHAHHMPMDTLLGALHEVVTVQVAQTPHMKSPTRTYVLADQHNGLIGFQLGEVLHSLQPGEDIILVQDRMGAYDVKSSYGDRICSMETEHQVWERYEGPQRNLRVILKNNNNGHHIKALKMGVRKALGAGTQDVLARTESSWSDTIARLVKQTDRPGKSSTATAALVRLDSHTPKRRIALFGVSKDDYGHGVPIVMLNIMRGLSGRAFTFSYIANHLDSNQIRYFDEANSGIDFENRTEFLNFVHRHGIQFDTLHFHAWHYADYYKPFHSKRDPLSLDLFLRQLGAPKVIYTDHANPTQDLRRIREHHGIDYAALSDDGKEAFLRTKNLHHFSVQEWLRGWDATSILCRRQMMQLADHVTHVSATQRLDEQQTILPHYSVNGKHVVVWNGTDLLDYRNLPEVQTRSKQLKQKKRKGQSVLYVGRAEKEKGIFDLATAAALLREAGFPVNLIFVGKFGSTLRQQLNRTATQENLYTGLIDNRAELAAHYMAADLIAQPTWGECFNQVISEGLAVGTASVVSNISGPKEVYVSNGIAIGHQPQAPHSLANSLRRGLTDGKLRRSIIDKGSQFVAQHLSVQNMAAQYATLYKN